MTSRRTLVAALAAAALLEGCSSCDRPPENAVTACDYQVEMGVVKTDILFVVDDSGSMSEEQANLQANLDAFITTIRSSPVRTDLRVAVTTTSVANWANATAIGEHGAFVGPVLDGNSPTLVADFKAQVMVGTSGSGKEQPLEAMKLALSPALLDAGNAGFLRPGARLAVVILSDEDDCSDTASPWADGNLKCHNDNADGIDYKATYLDPVQGYVDLLGLPLGPTGAQELRDVVVAAIAGVDAATGAPTCGWDAADPNRWCCGSSNNDVCVSGTAGSNTVTVPGPLTGDTYCVGNPAPATTCSSSCPTAYDKADRLTAFVNGFAADRRLIASICDASFSNTLTQIACMLVPQDVPLAVAPADWRLMAISLTGGPSPIPCEVTTAGAANEATADVVYTPPAGGQPGKLHFQNGCQLGCGKQIAIDLICAG